LNKRKSPYDLLKTSKKNMRAKLGLVVLYGTHTGDWY